MALQRYAAKPDQQTQIVAAADEYQSDFGLISVVPNRQMGRAGATVARNAFLIDASKVSLGMFDDIQLITPAKTGDAEKLCPRNRMDAPYGQRGGSGLHR